MSAVQVLPDRAFDIQAPPLIFIEAMLLVSERASDCLANESVLGLEVRIECTVGKAGLAHDPGDPRSRDAVPAEAFRGDVENMPPSRCLVTLLETHRPIHFADYKAPSRRSPFKQRSQVAIKLLRNGIDVIVAKLAKDGGRSIIFERDHAIAILAQEHPDGRVERR